MRNLKTMDSFFLGARLSLMDIVNLGSELNCLKILEYGQQNFESIDSDTKSNSPFFIDQYLKFRDLCMAESHCSFQFLIPRLFYQMPN